MLRWSGPVLLAMSALHFVMSFVLFHAEIVNIWRAGPGAGLNWSMGMLAAFWFLIFTWLMAAIAVAIMAAYKKYNDVPGKRAIGLSFILIPVASGIFLPASGLWAFLIPGVMLTFGKSDQG